MAFVFDKHGWTVTDTERQIILNGSRLGHGRDGERGGGQLVDLTWLGHWDNKTIRGHLFCDERCPDPNHMDAHWELHRIHIPESLLLQETEIVAVMEELVKHLPPVSNPNEVGKITTDFSNYHITGKISI